VKGIKQRKKRKHVSKRKQKQQTDKEHLWLHGAQPIQGPVTISKFRSNLSKYYCFHTQINNGDMANNEMLFLLMD
jgi:hypothetical protein